MWCYLSSYALTNDNHTGTTMRIITAALINLLICIPLAASAAFIYWSTPVDVSAATDVDIRGSLVEAFNAGANDVADQTVNGVLFTGTGALMNKSTDADAYDGTTGDTAYDALLSSIDYGGGSGLNTLSVGGGTSLSAWSILFRSGLWMTAIRIVKWTLAMETEMRSGLHPPLDSMRPVHLLPIPLHRI